MAWKGNPTNNQSSGKGINPAPNNSQENSNLSDIRSPQIQSQDTGNIIREDNTPIPLVGPYKKEFATRRDTDKTENFSVSLIDIDTTILDHMTNRLKLSVMDNGSLVSVPVLYASPERWKSIKKDGYLRDNQGKILLPAILINRSDVQNNKDLMTLNRYLSYQVMTNYDEKNKYDKFGILNPESGKPTKQIFNVTLPDQIVVTYKCIIWTDYVDQNNKLLEQINFGTNDYWGTDNFRFRTKVDSYTNTVELGAGEDRNVKTEFTLSVYAYLLPKTIDSVKSTTNKTFTVRKVKVEDEVVNTSYNLSADAQQNKINPYSYLKDYGVVYNQDKKEISEDIKVDSSKSSKSLPKTKSLFHPAPTSATDYGEDGWLAYDQNYFYIYVSPKGWLKREIATFDWDTTAQSYVSGYDTCGNPITLNAELQSNELQSVDPPQPFNPSRPINTAFRAFQRFPGDTYSQVPVTSTDYGQEGDISYDGSYFYVYARGEWRRFPISVFDSFPLPSPSVTPNP